MQAVFSACAKMCVRELRKTDTANVSVFYLSFCSTIGASIGLGISMVWGSGQGLMLPHAWEWALFAGIGKAFCGAMPNSMLAHCTAAMRLHCTAAMGFAELLFHIVQ